MVQRRDRRDLLTKRNRPVQDRQRRLGLSLLLLLPVAAAVGATVWYAYQLETRWAAADRSPVVANQSTTAGATDASPSGPLADLGRLLDFSPSAGPESGQVGAIPDRSYRVQLAALRSPMAAENAWRRLKAGHPDLLGGLEPTISQIDLGAKGVFHRLQVGPLTSREKADGLCSELTVREVWCLVIDP